MSAPSALDCVKILPYSDDSFIVITDGTIYKYDTVLQEPKVLHPKLNEQVLANLTFNAVVNEKDQMLYIFSFAGLFQIPLRKPAPAIKIDEWHLWFDSLRSPLIFNHTNKDANEIRVIDKSGGVIIHIPNPPVTTNVKPLERWPCSVESRRMFNNAPDRYHHQVEPKYSCLANRRTIQPFQLAKEFPKPDSIFTISTDSTHCNHGLVSIDVCSLDKEDAQRIVRAAAIREGGLCVHDQWGKFIVMIGGYRYVESSADTFGEYFTYSNILVFNIDTAELRISKIQCPKDHGHYDGINVRYSYARTSQIIQAFMLDAIQKKELPAIDFVNNLVIMITCSISFQELHLFHDEDRWILDFDEIVMNVGTLNIPFGNTTIRQCDVCNRWGEDCPHPTCRDAFGTLCNDCGLYYCTGCACNCVSNLVNALVNTIQQE